MALTKVDRETHKTTTHNGQDSASAVRGVWALWLAKAIHTRRGRWWRCLHWMHTEGDDDELGDSDCLPRLRTKWPRTYVYVTAVQRPRTYVYVLLILCARANPPWRYFTQRLQLCGIYLRAVSIRGRRLFAEIRYMQLCCWLISVLKAV